jgi:hypothetical protein
MTTSTFHPDDPGDRDRDGDGAPFGLPILREVPELAALLDDLTAIDRTVARIIDTLMLLEDTSLAETATGLAVERWMATVAGRTRADRRMLTTAVQACRRLPGVHRAFGAGQLSWAQLRMLALRVEPIPRTFDERIDTELTAAIELAVPSPDPDSLVTIVGQVLASYQPADHDPRRPTGAPDADFLAMQPRLDGTGGRIYGDFGPTGFAAIDNRLAGGPPSTATRDGFGDDPDPQRAGEAAGELARRRAARLVELCTRQPDDTAVVPASYVVRLDLATLLRLGQEQAATLLTQTTGGTMWLDAPTARLLADRHGARLRLVLTDQGRIVGVGRTTSRPPGWLREATLAIHDTCTAPGCRTAARVCDTDHARPWVDRGPTDIDNLAPLCATHNHTKETAGWRCHQQPDGTRTWHHPRSGITTTTLPGTWRPPPRPREHDPTSPTRHQDRAPRPKSADDRPSPHTDADDRGPPPAAAPRSPDSSRPRPPPSAPGGHPAHDPDDLPF